ncbi:MAG TPA: heavy metal translocating P-type ATPase [Candidatus Acidoferrales bacterium]|nr:heavy metal translocating P-type ATPase [Candidatus Acidoferrales bacterium]
MTDRSHRFAKLTSDTYIAGFTLIAIAAHIAMRYGTRLPRQAALIPLYIALLVGGVPLVWGLGRKLLKREFGSDLLAGVSILTACLLSEFLVAAIVVLMLSGGAALESYATAKASSVLDALARRVPNIAHRGEGSAMADIPLDEIRLGDKLVVYPHEICPVDGTVLEGHGVMDEAYLTGEPYEISKTPGSQVISGAINGTTALVIQTEKLPVNSRYARIMQVVRASEQQRPHLRRLADNLGAWYTPFALVIAAGAGIASGDANRFLAVVVIATPCPLLLAIPTAIIGAISLAARHAIIIKNPAVLEQIDTCQTLIFDKTGTLTYGRPTLTNLICAEGHYRNTILQLAASVEQYSKHPLSSAILTEAAAKHLALIPATHISERPGEGLQGTVAHHRVQITGRKKVADRKLPLPPPTTGLECLIFVDDVYAAAMTFHDAPRDESRMFIQHLAPKHGVKKIMLVSGDRETEVRYLAESVGITEIHAGKSPEEKVAIVKQETAKARTVFVGDGINDAPALLAATVGVAFGSANDIASEAADAVVLETTLAHIDQLMHIGRRLRRIALQSAVGGMAASLLGMAIAASGYLPPISGAIGQEVIDLLAVLNAVRVALPAGGLQDF